MDSTICFHSLLHAYRGNGACLVNRRGCTAPAPWTDVPGLFLADSSGEVAFYRAHPGVSIPPEQAPWQRRVLSDRRQFSSSHLGMKTKVSNFYPAMIRGPKLTRFWLLKGGTLGR